MYCGQMLYVSVFVKYKTRVQESLSSFFFVCLPYHLVSQGQHIAKMQAEIYWRH